MNRFNIAKTWKYRNYLLLCFCGNLSHFLFMNNKNFEKPWWREGVILFTKVSSYIAVPIILASFTGKFLDKKYNTNYIFYVFIVIAFISTLLLIWREMKVYKKNLDRQEIKKDN